MIDDFKRPEPRQRVHLDSNARSFNTHASVLHGRGMQLTGPAPDFQASDSQPAENPKVINPAAPAFGFSDTQALPTPAIVSDSDVDDPPIVPEHTADKPPKTPGKPITLFGKWTISRKKFILILSGVILLLAGGAAAYYHFVLDKPEPVKQAPAVVKAAPPPPAPIVSPLTGNVVDSKDKTTWPVIGAMIENSPDARPQSGLKNAGVVYEAIAEGGITRFLALYQEDRPGNIGPIRSSRPYYLDWAMAFDASYAHVGGSPDALARIKSLGVRDMDQFYNAGAYHRVTTRYAPHNVYTGVQQLADLSASKGWKTSTFTSFSRKKDNPYKAPAVTPASSVTNSTPASPPKETRTPANSINFSISGAYYNAHYDYDPTTNLYKRSEGGAPHLDAESKTQLTPKVVIALVMPYSLMADGYHSQYNTQGTGKMYVFQDGTVTTGTWTKGDPKSQFEFKDDSGKTLSLDAGQTWISVVGAANKVTYK